MDAERARGVRNLEWNFLLKVICFAPDVICRKYLLYPLALPMWRVLLQPSGVRIKEGWIEHHRASLGSCFAYFVTAEGWMAASSFASDAPTDVGDEFLSCRRSTPAAAEGICIR